MSRALSESTAEPSRETAGERLVPIKRIGIVAVHGVIPQVRYGFQDALADSLRTALDAITSQNEWTTSVVFQKTSTRNKTASVDKTNAPTITRVHRTDDKVADSPSKPFFDVREAYWSPLDKGKTTAPRVTGWLLRSIFLPINDTARYMERGGKIAWDISYLIICMTLGVLFFAAAAVIADLAVAQTGVALGLGHLALNLNAPLEIVRQLDVLTLAVLAAGVVGAFLVAQGIRAIWSLAHSLRLLLNADRVQLISRGVAIFLLFLLGITGLVTCALAPLHTNTRLGSVGLLLVAAVLAYQSGKALLFWFLQNFFGDVQIYTTRNENSDFFQLREQILDLVTCTIRDMIESAPSGQPYDRIYIFAHSLGSTIALDALMRLNNLHEAHLISDDDWRRIRGFVTFGTALEKTKYFFNAWSPTQSQAYEEWQDDLYGPLFTASRAALYEQIPSDGIYWLNFWYTSDFVSDGINSYRSYVLPGDDLSTRKTNRASALDHARKTGEVVEGRLVAENCNRFGDFAPWKFHFVTHGDYVGDQDWFWSNGQFGAVDVVTAGLTFARRSTRDWTSAHVRPYEAKSRRSAHEFRDG